MRLARIVSYYIPFMPRPGVRYAITDFDRNIMNTTAPHDYEGQHRLDLESSKIHLKCLAAKMERERVRYIPMDEIIHYERGAIFRATSWIYPTAFLFIFEGGDPGLLQPLLTFYEEGGHPLIISGATLFACCRNEAANRSWKLSEAHSDVLDKIWWK